MKFKSKVKN